MTCKLQGLRAHFVLYVPSLFTRTNFNFLFPAVFRKLIAILVNYSFAVSFSLPFVSGVRDLILKVVTENLI